MRVIPRVVVASTRIIGLIVPAFAAEMTGAEITGYLSGKTAYLETTAVSGSGAAGQAVFYSGQR